MYRRIKISRLLLGGLFYRLHIVAAHTLFLYFFYGEWKLAFGTSALWSVVNMGLYYNFHYWFYRTVRLGKDVHEK